MTPNQTQAPLHSFGLGINANTQPLFQGLPPLHGARLPEGPSLALRSAHAGPEGIIPTQSFIGILGYSIAAVHAPYV